MKICLLHYTFFPVPGGVESVMESHAALLADHGHRVTVVCGRGAAPRGAGYRVVQNRSIAERTLPGPALDRHLNAAGIVIAHNVCTMPFHPALARRLRDWSTHNGNRLIAWTHDIAAGNPEYTLSTPAERELFGQTWPGVEYVCVSSQRAAELAGLGPTRPIRVIPNGIDALDVLRIDGRLRDWFRDGNIAERDIVLFHPTRILRRKRIGEGIHLLAALRAMNKDAVLLISGAPDPHRPESAIHAGELRELACRLGVEDSVALLGTGGPLVRDEVAACYRVCDAVVFPSAEEGFGLPPLEAAIHGKPLIASDIPTTRHTAPRSTIWLSGPPEQTARALIRFLGKDSAFTARKEALQRFAWQRIYSEHIRPLLGDGSRTD